MSQLENQTEIASSDKVSFVERFEAEKAEWKEIVQGIAKKFRNIEEMVDVQVDLYSQRQVIVDYQSQLSTLYARMKKAYLTEWKKAYKACDRDEDRVYNEREKTKMADEMTSATKLKMDIVQQHIEFFKDTKAGIDSMIFGIKNRIDIEGFRRDMK